MSTSTDCDIGRFPHDLTVAPCGWQPRRRDSLAAKLSRFSLWLIDYVLIKARAEDGDSADGYRKPTDALNDTDINHRGMTVRPGRIRSCEVVGIRLVD